MSGNPVSQMARFWQWVKVHPVIVGGVAITSFLMTTVIPVLGNLQAVLEWSGIRKPYYGLYTGEALLATVPLIEGQHQLFSLQGGYPGDSTKASIYGDRCTWSLVINQEVVELDRNACGISSDRIITELPHPGKFELLLQATNSLGRKLHNPDGTETWSTTLSYRPPQVSQPPQQTSISEVVPAGHPPETAFKTRENAMTSSRPQRLEDVIKSLGPTENNERYLRLNDNLAAIKQANVLNAQDVVALLDGIRDPQLRINAIVNWFLPLLSAPLSIGDTRLLLLGLQGSDQTELLAQLKPCIKNVDSPTTRESLLEGFMGEEWKERDRALRSSSIACQAGSFATKYR